MTTTSSAIRLAVVGLGAAGLAAAMSAARERAVVVGFEQSDLDNQAASSGGRGKIIRFGYDDPFFADLMKSTMPRWDDLAERSGQRLMDRHGGLHVASPDMIAVVAGGIGAAGQPYQELVAGAGRLRDFGAVLADGEPGVYEPGAGVMWTSRVRAALAAQARAAGAELRDHTPVLELSPRAAGVAVRTPEGSEDFDRVILSGGPWSFRLAPGAADAFEITRRFQLVYATDEPIGDGLPRPWIDHSGIGYYGMLNVADRTHLIGLHELDQEQRVRDPDEPQDAAIRDASIEHEIEYVTRRFGLRTRPRVVDIRACHYTSTATRDFVVDDCPGLPHVTLLSPCSGHGFKFAVSTGAYAATHATGGNIPDRDRFRLRTQPATR